MLRRICGGSGKELEEYNSPDGKPSPIICAEEFLEIFASNIQAIQKSHGDGLQKIISLWRTPLVRSRGKKVAAEYLALGKTLEEIAKRKKRVAEDFRTRKCRCRKPISAPRARVCRGFGQRQTSARKKNFGRNSGVSASRLPGRILRRFRSKSKVDF